MFPVFVVRDALVRNASQADPHRSKFQSFPVGFSFSAGIKRR